MGGVFLVDYEKYRRGYKSRKFTNEEQKEIIKLFDVVKEAVWNRNHELFSEDRNKEVYEVGYGMNKLLSKAVYPDFNRLELQKLVQYMQVDEHINRNFDMMTDNEIVDLLYYLSKAYLEKEEMRKKDIGNEDIKVDIPINSIDKPEVRLDCDCSKSIRIYPRNLSRVKQAIEQGNYNCEIDVTHRWFTCNKTEKNYVEGHHLIPLQFQDEFQDNSLDVTANIIPLCVICHKKLHHAMFQEKKVLIDKLFAIRKERLVACGLEINIEKLYSYYNSEIVED